jgi:hypothetical protein
LTDLDPSKISEKGSMALALVPLKSSFGIVETNGDLVSRFVEKPLIHGHMDLMLACTTSQMKFPILAK